MENMQEEVDGGSDWEAVPVHSGAGYHKHKHKHWLTLQHSICSSFPFSALYID